MDETYEIPHDTREFLAQWNAATEAHLSAKLRDILRQLGDAAVPLEDIPSELYEVLTPLLLRALQVAAQPGATVHDGISYLEGLIAER